MPPQTELLIDRQAPVRRVVLDASSWVDVVDRFVPNAERHFADLTSAVEWSQRAVLRYDRYVAENRVGASWPAERFPLTRQTDLHLQSVYRVPFDGVVAILYRDSTDFMGLHSDREMRWLDDTRIAILVLGERRRFVLRPRGQWLEAVASPVAQGEHERDVTLRPGDGDLIIMGGRCQRDWMHGVPHEPTAVGPRLSLTWRWTSRRGRPDTGPSYSDGRQYSDVARRPGIRTRRGTPD